MNTREIECALDNFPAFGGVYARDQLDTLPMAAFPKAFVINTDVSTGPGEHWVAVYQTGDCNEYFDSYGRGPLPEVVDYFNRTGNITYTFNSIPLQSIGSVVCGQYCLFYLYHRMQYNTRLGSIIRHLNRYGPFVTDNYVNEFVSRYLHVKADAYTVDNFMQVCKPYFNYC